MNEREALHGKRQPVHDCKKRGGCAGALSEERGGAGGRDHHRGHRLHRPHKRDCRPLHRQNL